MGALSPARQLAYRVVLTVEKSESFAHETLSRELDNAQLDDRDKAFATRLAYGVIAYRGTLLDLLKRLSSKKQMPAPEVSCALQIALYEIFIDNQKDFVAVNQGVELVKQVAPYARGFANAVLRSATRMRPEFPFGDVTKQSDALARQEGLPQWLVDQLIAEYGFEQTTLMARAFNEPPALFASVPVWSGSRESVIDSLARQNVEAVPVSDALPFALELKNSSQAVKTAAIMKRHILLMDSAAQLTVKMADARPKQSIMEMGAGRGNKSLMLASSARAQGGPAKEIISVDLHAFKSELLAKEAKRLNVREISTLTFDGTDLDAMREHLGDRLFDSLVIDAPCSGVGTLRRHIDKRWTLKPTDSRELGRLNEKLLWANAHFVKPGGKIIYATCTMFNEENGHVISEFLKTELGDEYTIEPIVPADVPSGWERFILKDGTFQSIPEIGGPDGHFIAVLRRKK